MTLITYRAPFSEVIQPARRFRIVMIGSTPTAKKDKVIEQVTRNQR